MNKLAIVSGIAAIVLCSAPSAFGQAKIVPEDEINGSTEKDVQGWNPSLSVNGTFNIVNNTNVVGQVEGTSALLGLGASGGADYTDGPVVWRTKLTINEGFAKTPVVDNFVKTNDELALESIYNYFLAKKMGLFGRAQVSTALFPARAVTADPVTYVIRSADPDGMDRAVTSDNLKVANAFKPFNIGYSAGGFAEPINGEKLAVKVRAGLGGRHTFASEVFVDNDDSTTAARELQELANVHQAGAELFAGLDGSAQGGRLKYSAGASMLLPFINNDKYDRSATDLIRVAFEATASVAIFDWMGLVYKGTVIVDPQLFPQDQELTQIQNNLLLTFQYTLIDRQKSRAELEKEAAAEKEKQALEAAEQRAIQAEERANELQEALERSKREAAEPPASTSDSPLPAAPSSPIDPSTPPETTTSPPSEGSP